MFGWSKEVKASITVDEEDEEVITLSEIKLAVEARDEITRVARNATLRVESYVSISLTTEQANALSKFLHHLNFGILTIMPEVKK